MSGEYSLAYTYETEDLRPLPKWQLRLVTDSTDQLITGAFSADGLHPTCDGNWTQSSLQFAQQFQLENVFWKAFVACLPVGLDEPAFVSIIIRKVTDDCWWLDVCFTFTPEKLQDGSIKRGFIRAEYWHTSNRPGTELTPIEANQRLIEETAERIAEVKDEIEGAAFEIDDWSAVVDQAVAALEGKEKELASLSIDVTTAHKDMGDAADDVAEAMMDQHMRAESRAGLSYADSICDPIGDSMASLRDAECEAESLADEIDEIGQSVQDLAEDAMASLWTTANYAVGQRMLRRLKSAQNEPDLSFLEPFQTSVSRLLPDVQKMLSAAAVLYAVARQDEILHDKDYGCVVAAMAKCCERAFADGFDARKAVILSHPVVQMILTEKGDKRRFDIPPVETGVDKSKLGNLLEALAKSATKNEMRWSGTRNCGLAILLFSGRLGVWTGTQFECLDFFHDTSKADAFRLLPQRLIEFQELRNGFIHESFAAVSDVEQMWPCFADCMRGILCAFYC